MADNDQSANSTNSGDESSGNWQMNPTADILKEGIVNTLKPVLDQVTEKVSSTRYNFRNKMFNLKLLENPTGSQPCI